MGDRNRLLALLCALSLITYLDRVCISVAGPRIQQELAISPAQWGWVTGAFALAYGLFEWPSGRWADRAGAGPVLTRIVIWWSVFTALTGAVSSLGALVVVRFLFGAGEAGAYPNMASMISRRFPETSRARAFGLIWMTSQLGGAAAPLLVVPLQAIWGWRASFVLFGIAGLAWALAWRTAGRDSGAAPVRRDWRAALRVPGVRVLMGIGFCYVLAQYLFIAWLHTYLVRGRGFAESELYWTSAPFLLGALANVAGGFASDAAAARFGSWQGRRIIGAAGLAMSAACLTAAAFAGDKSLLLLLLAGAYSGTALQQPAVWAACIDTGGKQSGAVSALMNTAGQFGSFVLAIGYGSLVQWFGSYDLALAPVIAALLTGSALWLAMDPIAAPG